MKVKVCGLLDGFMIWWTEVKNAAIYHVHLCIVDENRVEINDNGHLKKVPGKITTQEITVVDVDRQTKYHSFTGLAKIYTQCFYDHHYGGWKTETTGVYYIVFVEAEDREGKIIDCSDKISPRFKTIRGELLADD